MELFNNTDSDPGREDSHRTDDEIKQNIERLFGGNEITKRQHINVTVEKGVVTLDGRVDSPQTWQTAADLAADVRGIRELRNKIQVGSGSAS